MGIFWEFIHVRNSLNCDCESTDRSFFHKRAAMEKNWYKEQKAGKGNGKHQSAGFLAYLLGLRTWSILLLKESNLESSLSRWFILPFLSDWIFLLLWEGCDVVCESENNILARQI